MRHRKSTAVERQTNRNECIAGFSIHSHRLETVCENLY